jgi:hypothetical protein
MARIRNFAAALAFTACAGNVPANYANAANTAEKTFSLSFDQWAAGNVPE